MERLLAAAGGSTEADAGEAGRASAAEAVAGLGGLEPVLVLVYSSIRYDLVELLAGVRSVTGAVPLAGSTSAGHFAGRGSDPAVMGPGEGVMVLALGGGDYRFGVGWAPGLATDPEAAGAEAARAARAAARTPTTSDPADPSTAADFSADVSTAGGAVGGSGEAAAYSAVVLFTDGLGGDQQAVLTGVHRVAGAAVPVVGGSGGDDGRLERIGLFHGDDVLFGGVVAVWFESPRPLTVGSTHGWSPISLPVLVTRSEGTAIHELGGRSASEVYEELSARFEGQRGNDGRTVFQPSYALGMIEPDGSHLIRGVYEDQDGQIRTATPLPPYTAVQVMTADLPTTLGVVEGVVDEVMAEGEPSVVLVFDCIARMVIMGDEFPQEAALIVKAAGDATVFGMYTYGEFARSNGVGGVHNATLTALAL